MKWQLRAQRNLLRQTVDVYASMLAPNGEVGAVSSMTVETVEPGTQMPDTPFRLTDEQGQQLIDDLYRAGFRPSDAQGTAGQLEAMKAHLDDMRKAYEVVLVQAKVMGTPVFIPGADR